MIGIIERTNTEIMDRKRRRSISDSQSEVTSISYLSTPPKWHLSLKRHFNFVEEPELPSLGDITQLLVGSGYVNAIDICYLAQTCTKLHRITNRQSTWLLLSEQEFPGSTKQIPNQVIKERGYKWLYRSLKSSIQSQSRTNSNELISLPPPRLGADQMMILIRFSRNDSSLHNIPISLTGNELLTLLNTGRMTYKLPNPVVLDTCIVEPTTNGLLTSESSTCQPKQTVNVHTYEYDIKNLNLRMHLLSIPDATMCCIYDITMESSTMIQFAMGETNGCIDFGPNDMNEYHKHVLSLQHSSLASEIKHRLSYNSILFHVGLHCGIINRSDDNNPQQQQYYGITALDIKILKYDHHHHHHHHNSNMSSTSDCIVFDSTQIEQNSGVTICHYLSELQMS